MTEKQLAYREYLKSPHWQKVKQHYWSSKLDKVCHFCKTTEGLQLHHKYGYRRMGEEKMLHLVLLCSSCHKDIHFYKGKRVPLEYKSIYKSYKRVKGKWKIR